MTGTFPETASLADQLARIYGGPAWMGPDLKELLSKVSNEKASAKILPEAHTIWELVLHISTWLRVARERLSASDVLDPTKEEDWPAIRQPWSDALGQLDSEVRALQQAILAFPPERLHERAPASEPQTFYVLLHGVIQHTAYHAGQIALLAK